MKTIKLQKTAVSGMFIAILAGTIPANAGVPMPYGANDGAASDQPALLHTSTALSHALHSYLNFEGVEAKSAKPQIVYVDQAYGQAIYSYPRVAPDIVTAFNVEYVNPAYSQAIFSYPRADEWPGSVELEQLRVE